MAEVRTQIRPLVIPLTARERAAIEAFALRNKMTNAQAVLSALSPILGLRKSDGLRNLTEMASRFIKV